MLNRKQLFLNGNKLLSVTRLDVAESLAFISKVLGILVPDQGLRAIRDHELVFVADVDARASTDQ
jgi:uncharacterized protein (DUF2164 family)